MHLTYHGQSVFELNQGDTRVLIDPWIDENPHCDRTVDDFDDVDAILVTHGAYDHYGDAPEIATNNDAELVCDYATYTVLSDGEFPDDLLTGMIYGQRIERDGWAAKAVLAHHLSMFPEQKLIGPALAYIVSIGGERVYHMGDTSIFGDIQLYGELYDPTVCLIPVGEAEGSLPDMYPEEAALATEWLEPDVAVPMHYPPDSERTLEYERFCTDRGLDETTRIELLGAGESIQF